MQVDSLDELESAFAQWRRSKTYAREPMPEELRARARRAAEKHGVKAVVSVTRVERARLFRTRPSRTKAREATSTKPKDVEKSDTTPYMALLKGALSIMLEAASRQVPARAPSPAPDEQEQRTKRHDSR